MITHNVNVSANEIKAIIQKEMSQRYPNHIIKDVSFVIVNPMDEYRRQARYTDCVAPPADPRPYIQDVKISLQEKTA